MRPIPLLAAANGVGDPAAHPRGGAPNAGDWERERGELPPPTFPRRPRGLRGFVLYAKGVKDGKHVLRPIPPHTLLLVLIIFSFSARTRNRWRRRHRLAEYIRIGVICPLVVAALELRDNVAGKRTRPRCRAMPSNAATRLRSSFFLFPLNLSLSPFFNCSAPTRREKEERERVRVRVRTSAGQERG
jgi:hypothetical protein